MVVESLCQINEVTFEKKKTEIVIILVLRMNIAISNTVNYNFIIAILLQFCLKLVERA